MSFTPFRRKIFRRTLRIVAGALCVLLLLWLGLGWYINTHADEIKARIAAMLSAEVRGDLRIGSMEPSVFRSFPNVAMRLRDVSLRDSLWQQHRHSLLEARDMNVELNPFALLSHRVEIRKLSLAHGAVFLYTDTAGYSNAYLLARRDTTRRNHPALIDRYAMSDMEFWFVNEAKQKRFHFTLADVDGSASRAGGTITYRAGIRAHVHEMAFSIIRGSYLRGQDVSMDATIRYHIDGKRLEVPEQTMIVGGAPILMGGNFYFNRTPAAFDMHLHANDIPYQKAVALVSQNISRIMQPFDFSKPMSLDARVSGVMEYHNIPLINVVATIDDNTLKTPLGAVDKVSFVATYNNELAPGRGHGDDNSSIVLRDLHGSWQGLPFTGDTLMVSNLLRPYVHAHVQSAFQLQVLNNVVGGNSFSFDGGSATADIRYVGGIVPDDPTPYAINGTVRLRDGRLSYLPRNLAFSNVGASLLFQGDNLLLRDVSLRSKGSSVMMEGEAMHFTRLYFSDPGKVAIAWRVRGPMVNLNDFLAFAGKRRTVQTVSRPRAAAIARIGAGLDRVLAESSFALDARIDRMSYRNFTADAVVARLNIGQSGIFLQEISLGNGGGTVRISGTVNQSAPNNPFVLKAQVRNADVARLFAAFDNFGQSAITAGNLQGQVNADADVKGNVTDGGAILPASIYGSVSFRLNEGRIMRFAPFEKVGRFIFKKRNLSDVAVKDLQGRLDVAGDKIFIRPMTIQTSVLNMDVQGVYGLKGGTDIYLQLPLRNPENEGAKTPIGALLRKGKGFVVHLRAQDPDGSGVHIGWDPLRRGRKAGSGDTALSVR